jgi:hypothetical protein
MNSYNHILTKKEKAIINDMFIENNNSNNFNSSIKDFKKLCASIIRRYTGKPFFVGNKWKNEIKDYSINLIWDKNTNQTVFMYLFANPNYKYSSNFFEQFKDLNSDFNAVDNDGSTALMYLAKNLNRYTLCSDIIKQNQNFNLYIKDKYGKTFHMYFFEQYTEDTFAYKYNNEDLKNFSFLGKLSLFKTVLFDWINTNITKEKEHLLFVSEKCFLLVKNINYDQKFPAVDKLKEIEKLAEKLQLEAEMNINKNNQKKPKM